MLRTLWMIVAFAATLLPLTLQAQEAAKMRVYFGTYTGSGSKGIYVGELDLKSGELKLLGVAGEVDNPSFLSIHPNKKFLYAVGEIGNFRGKKAGAVTAFAIDAKDGTLKQLNQQSTVGDGPCHISIDKTGKTVLVANYGGGSVASFPVKDNGELGEAASFVQHEGASVDKGRQEAPHGHSINPSPDNRFAMAADLGLDKILVYKLDAAAGKIAPNEPAFTTTIAGGGPRHFAFHPGAKFAFVCNEMKSSASSFAYDAEKGVLTLLETLSTLPDGKEVKGNSTAEIQVHPSGKFVYVSNRGHDSLAIFSFDEATGKLAVVGHQATGGKTPRNFGIDPTGMYIIACNQGSHTAHVFRIDAKTGKLEPTGSKVEIPSPVCVKFLQP